MGKHMKLIILHSPIKKPTLQAAEGEEPALIVHYREFGDLKFSTLTIVLVHLTPLITVENSYHLWCSKTSPPSLGALHGHVLMQHKGPGMLLPNLVFVSKASTCDILSQTVHHELDVFLEAFHHWYLAGGQVFSIFVRFFHPILPTHHLWVYLV